MVENMLILTVKGYMNIKKNIIKSIVNIDSNNSENIIKHIVKKQLERLSKENRTKKV